jgi:hypothetical protein
MRRLLEVHMAELRNISPRLIRASRIMAWLSLAGAFVYLAMDLGTFLAPDTMNAFGAFEAHHTGAPISGAIPFAYRLAALVVELIPAALVVWALLELYRLFVSYAQGQVFSQTALRSLSRVAMLMFLQVLLSFVAEAPITYFLSLARPPGHREITLTFGSHDASFLFMAGAVLVIARVMAEARRVADENAAFV